MISSPDPPKKAQKGGRDSKMVTAKKATQLESHPPSPKTESTEPASVTGDPLLEEGEGVDGTIVLPGNTTLASLSVSNNLITERGLEAFLDAIDIQKQYSHRGQGLIRLEFKVFHCILIISLQIFLTEQFVFKNQLSSKTT